MGFVIVKGYKYLSIEVLKVSQSVSGRKADISYCLVRRTYSEKLDGLGPVDNRPSTDKLHHFVRKKK